MKSQLEQIQRMRRQKQVKSKIQEIMNSVKQQKQHIENKLATNDHKIQLYSQQYQALKQKNDFSQLKREERIILLELANSLEENGIDVSAIIGGQEMGLLNLWDNLNKDKEQQSTSQRTVTNTNHNNKQNKNSKKLSNEQIISVQTMLIDKLAKQLLAKTKREEQTK